jgi:hypothetical protein
MKFSSLSSTSITTMRKNSSGSVVYYFVVQTQFSDLPVVDELLKFPVHLCLKKLIAIFILISSRQYFWYGTSTNPLNNLWLSNVSKQNVEPKLTCY